MLDGFLDFRTAHGSGDEPLLIINVVYLESIIQVHLPNSGV
jgi:hypothetical protein